MDTSGHRLTPSVAGDQPIALSNTEGKTLPDVITGTSGGVASINWEVRSKRRRDCP
jgi:hypothetical protein